MALYLCGLPPSNPRVCVCAPVAQCVQRFETLWTVACQTPLSVGFFCQEYCSGLPLPTPGEFSRPGIEPMSPVSDALAGEFFTTEPPGKPLIH